MPVVLIDNHHSLLFTGLLINRETVTPALQWLHTVSFFHAAFEALAVNELRYLQLKEIKVTSMTNFCSSSSHVFASVWR
jgi:hypothetical protein